ncbi:MAG: ABC transporter ATP-binding protein [Calditrichaeota bacterium]|nr:ABC transporter ATP-binding protein [Calditrichota bacterium]
MAVKAGEIVVIMGPSGVGKSTLLNIIGTLDKPTGGKVWIDGQDMSQLDEARLARFRNQHIGFVFQFHYLLPEFTALENVLIPRMIKGNDWKKDRQRAIQLLEEVGLGARLHHRPNQLSGGEQQRVAVARALMNQPKLVLADEPTGDLDRRNSEALFELILSLNEKYNQTFIIVTHNEMFAERAHRVIHLWDGKIVDEKVLKV